MIKFANFKERTNLIFPNLTTRKKTGAAKFKRVKFKNFIGKIILFRAKSKARRLNLSVKFEKERPSLRPLIYQISSDEKVIWRQNRPRRDDGRRDETRDDDFF